LGQTDTSRSRTVLASTAYTSTFHRHLTWKAGLQASLQTAQVDGYADSSRWFSQRRAAAFAMAERSWSKARISLLVRQELAEGTAVPFTGSVGGQFKAGRVGEGRFHVSRNFNLPTLNDRYWRTLGNAELLSEYGYSADAGWRFQRSGFSTELSVFQLIVDNWILWQPGADGQFRPGNLRKVWSRGVEWTGQYQWQSGDWRWTMSSRYQFTKATNVAVYAGEGGALHRELPYTPKHTGGLTLSVRKGKFSAAYLHQLTGKRFVTSDNATVVQGFSMGNLLVRHDFFLQRKKTSRGIQAALDARLENVWNTSYQVLAYRPMPGRAWRTGLEIRF
jgi:iron complex outermembrane receptor protein